MKKNLIDRVVGRGLALAFWRFKKPSVISHLLDLHWSETMIAEHLGVSPSAVSNWLTGRNRIRDKHFQGLIQLLRDTVERYEVRINRLRKRGQWSEFEQEYMRYRIRSAKWYLTNYDKYLVRKERERLEDAA